MLGTSKSVWGFDPRSVPGCQLWLDGADINGNGTAFSVGGTISTWVDKSSLGNNMTGTSVTYTYDSTFRANAPTFNGSSSVFNQANSGLYSLNNATTWTIFTVNRRTNTSGYNAVYNAKSPGSGQNNYLIYRYLPSAGGFQFYLGDTTSSYIDSLTGTGDGITTLTAQTSGTAEGFINGSSIGTGSTSSSSGQATFTIGLQTGCYMFGFIFEVLVYNIGLTTSERQQVEGYLAHKWGLQTSIPSTHPFYSIRPHLRAFNPTDVPGCALWLDGADSSSLVLSGSNVTQWNDKSGNGFNGTVVNASVGSPIAPSYVTNSINGLSAITMSGTSYFTGSTNVNSTTLTCFFIGNCVFGTGGSSQQRILGLSVPGLDDYSSTLRPIPLSVISGGTQLIAYRNAGMASAIVVSGTNFIGCCLFDGTSNYMYKDGILGTQVASSGTFTTSIYGVGSDAGTQFMGATSSLGTNCLVGKIGEIIVYNTALTTSQRQQVEGYLAHKWGLSTNLFSPLSIPLSISGCTLWLDSADSSTITFSSGSNVNVWRDKSASGSNATASTTGLIYTSNAINSKNAILFPGNSTHAFFTGSLTNPSPDISIFIVVTAISGITAYARLFGFGGSNDFNNIGNMVIDWNATTPGGINVERNKLITPTVNPIAFSTPFITSTTISGTSVLGYINTSNTLTGTTTSANFTFSQYQVGSYTGFSGYSWYGYIGEILVYNTALTTFQRQTVEGYLANKWGIISSSIPSTHSFKSIPPASLHVITSATGGTIVTNGITKFHVFTSSGSFVLTVAGRINYLVVGGGGGGGDRHGGGGGAGGVLSGSWNASVGTYTVTVGLGGAGGSYQQRTGGQNPQGAGFKGGDSSLSGTGISQTAYGGGGGGTYGGNPSGTFGSGGGGGGNSLPGIAGTSGQGNSGGAGSSSTTAGGGGGGAGGAGVAAEVSTGGIGTSAYSNQLLAAGYGTTFAVATSPNTVISGGVAYIAGGGGGGSGVEPEPGGLGGLGGGGRGDWDVTYISTGTPNTGGGGGGSRSRNEPSDGVAGGSGLVLVWY
jgi:hypothetical protein